MTLNPSRFSPDVPRRGLLVGVILVPDDDFVPGTKLQAGDDRVVGLARVANQGDLVCIGADLFRQRYSRRRPQFCRTSHDFEKMDPDRRPGSIRHIDAGRSPGLGTNWRRLTIVNPSRRTNWSRTRLQAASSIGPAAAGRLAAATGLSAAAAVPARTPAIRLRRGHPVRTRRNIGGSSAALSWTLLGAAILTHWL